MHRCKFRAGRTDPGCPCAEHGPGDEVIVPANTYIASVLGITETERRRFFVEPDRYFCIDSEQIEQAVTDKTKAICRCIYTVSPVRWIQYKLLQRRYGLYVIEDLCTVARCGLQGKEDGNFREDRMLQFLIRQNRWGRSAMPEHC